MTISHFPYFPQKFSNLFTLKFAVCEKGLIDKKKLNENYTAYLNLFRAKSDLLLAANVLNENCIQLLLYFTLKLF